MLIRKELVDRARDFNIILDDVSLTELSFGKEYTAAVESKQVAQQEAQRAAFFVERAVQEKQQKIVQAEGEAEAAKMISFSKFNNFIAQRFERRVDEVWAGLRVVILNVSLHGSRFFCRLHGSRFFCRRIVGLGIRDRCI